MHFWNLSLTIHLTRCCGQNSLDSRNFTLVFLCCFFLLLCSFVGSCGLFHRLQPLWMCLCTSVGSPCSAVPSEVYLLGVRPSWAAIPFGGCICCSMGPTWAAVPSGAYLLLHGSLRKTQSLFGGCYLQHWLPTGDSPIGSVAPLPWSIFFQEDVSSGISNNVLFHTSLMFLLPVLQTRLFTYLLAYLLLCLLLLAVEAFS